MKKQVSKIALAITSTIISGSLSVVVDANNVKFEKPIAKLESKSNMFDYERNLLFANKLTTEHLAKRENFSEVLSDIYTKNDNKIVTKKPVIDETVLTKVVKVVVEEQSPARPIYKEVTLSVDLLDYIWELCGYDIEFYKTVLSIAYVESKFDVNVPVSKTNDYGLFQINANNLDVRKENNFATVAGVKPRSDKKYTSFEFAKIAITHLEDLEKSWTDKGITREQEQIAILLSYNRGLSGAKKYIKNNGYSKSNSYVKKVFEFRDTL